MVRLRAHRRSGHAIVIALVVLVLVAAAGAAIATFLQLEMRSSLQESRRIQLVALGDAALAEALAELSRSRAYRGSAERRFGKGTIGSTVRAIGVDRYEIVSTATVTGRDRRVVAEVSFSGSKPSLVSWKLTP